MNKFRWAAVALLSILLMTGCSSFGYKDSSINELCLIYSGGTWEDASYQGLLRPGSNNRSTGVGSSTYCYRIDQRTYIANADNNGADSAPVRVVSSDDQRMLVDYELYFTLNQDEEILRQFHENLGVKTKAWTNDGWVQLLREYLKPQIERALESAALEQPWRDLYASNDARVEFQNATIANLRRNINEVIGGDYFCGPDYTGENECGDFTLTIGKPIPENTDLVAALESEQVAEARQTAIEQEQANLDAQAAAEAERDNQRIQTLLQQEQALIDAYGPQGALLWKAIQSGNIPMMVVPSDGSISIPATVPQD